MSSGQKSRVHLSVFGLDIGSARKACLSPAALGPASAVTGQAASYGHLVLDVPLEPIIRLAVAVFSDL